MSTPNRWESSGDWRTRSSNEPSAQTGQASTGGKNRSSGSWRSGNSGPAQSSPRQQQPQQQRQPILRWAERPRAQDVKVHRPERQQDDPGAEQAIAEGRRIYLGNLLYQAQPADIEDLLAEAGLADAEKKIHISLDPFSGRNPGYCFLEFADRATADGAMEALEGRPLFGRPVKSRPCLPKGERRRAGREPDRSDDPTSRRWGDFGNTANGDDEAAGGAPLVKEYGDRAVREGRQLYVGGLPRMLDQAENDVEMRDIFKDFEVVEVSKRISPDERHRATPSERRNFCFVNFSTPDQARLALEATRGTQYRGAPLKVSYAKGNLQAKERAKYQNPAAA